HDALPILTGQRLSFPDATIQICRVCRLQLTAQPAKRNRHARAEAPCHAEFECQTAELLESVAGIDALLDVAESAGPDPPALAWGALSGEDEQRRDPRRRIADSDHGAAPAAGRITRIVCASRSALRCRIC